MRKFHLIIIAFLSLSACTVGDQVKELKALKDCSFSISSIEKIDISGVDMHKIIQSGEINILSMPSLALGFLEKKVPLTASLVVQIENPNESNAAINEFDYKLLIGEYEVFEGTIDQQISIPANETSLIPIDFSFDVYKFLADDSIRNNIQNFIQASRGQEVKEAKLTIKIKPSILIGNQLIKYPGFIDIERTFNSKLLLSYDQFL